MNHWEILGIEPTSNKRAIQKAYSNLLKLNKPRSNPKGYQILREAYDAALNQIKKREHNTSFQSRTIDTIKQHKVKKDKFNRISKTNISEDNLETKNYHNENNNINYTYRAETLLRDTLRDIKSSTTVDKLESIYSSDEFLNISLKESYEAKLFEHFLNCQEQEFDYPLAAKAVQLFDWDKYTHLQKKLREKIKDFYIRLDSAKRYHELKCLTNEKTTRKNKKNKKVAKVLTSTLNIRYFKILFFRKLFINDIKDYLDQLDTENPDAFNYEFNTQTINWWRENLHTHHFTITHVWTGFLIGPTFSLGLLNILELTGLNINHLNPPILAALLITILLIGTAIGSYISYKISLLFKSTFTKYKILKQNQQKIAKNIDIAITVLGCLLLAALLPAGWDILSAIMAILIPAISHNKVSEDTVNIALVCSGLVIATYTTGKLSIGIAIITAILAMAYFKNLFFIFIVCYLYAIFGSGMANSIFGWIKEPSYPVPYITFLATISALTHKYILQILTEKAKPISLEASLSLILLISFSISLLTTIILNTWG